MAKLAVSLRKGLTAHQSPGAEGGDHLADGQRHEEYDDQQLEGHEHVVGLVRQLDAQGVLQRGDDDDSHDPEPDGDAGELGAK